MYIKKEENEFPISIGLMVDQCLESGIDPLEILSHALSEKARMDSLIHEALYEEPEYFIKSSLKNIELNC